MNNRYTLKLSFIESFYMIAYIFLIFELKMHVLDNKHRKTNLKYDDIARFFAATLPFKGTSIDSFRTGFETIVRVLSRSQVSLFMCVILKQSLSLFPIYSISFYSFVL
jgi:hypothetical protein